jgi:hypothetical protein
MPTAEGNPGTPAKPDRDALIDLIRSEAYRRILAGEALETLTALAEHLSQWLRATHLIGTSISLGMIEGHVGGTRHRCHERDGGGQGIPVARSR